MEMNYPQGIFIIVNTLLALYIFIYALVFLKRTNEHPISERRPWILLFFGALFFLLSQILSVIWLYGNQAIFGMNIFTIKVLFEFVYGGLVLLAFITQSHLILLKDILVIVRKLKSKTKEKELEQDIDKEMTEISKKFYK